MEERATTAFFFPSLPHRREDGGGRKTFWVPSSPVGLQPAPPTAAVPPATFVAPRRRGWKSPDSPSFSPLPHCWLLHYSPTTWRASRSATTTAPTGCAWRRCPPMALSISTDWPRSLATCWMCGCCVTCAAVGLAFDRDTRYDPDDPSRCAVGRCGSVPVHPDRRR